MRFYPYNTSLFCARDNFGRSNGSFISGVE